MVPSLRAAFRSSLPVCLPLQPPCRSVPSRWPTDGPAPAGPATHSLLQQSPHKHGMPISHCSLGFSYACHNRVTAGERILHPLTLCELTLVVRSASGRGTVATRPGRARRYRLGQGASTPFRQVADLRQACLEGEALAQRHPARSERDQRGDIRCFDAQRQHACCTDHA